MFGNAENFEYSVVGAVCIEPSIVRKIAGKVNPEDFEDKACAAVMEAAFNADATGSVFDAVIAANAAAAIKGDNAQRFIMDCMDITPTVVNAVHHAELVRKAAGVRALRADVSQALLGDDPADMAANITGICKAHLESANTKRMKSLNNVLLDIYQSSDRKTLRVDTGFPRVDSVLKGMWGGNLCILGARPGVGKTAFALNIAVNAARRGHKVLLYSMEMLADEVVERILAQTYVTMDELIELGKNDKAVWNKVTKASQAVYGLPIIINDDPGTTVSKIRAQALQTQDLHLIIVDFLTLMKTDRRYDNRNLEVGAISRGLKMLAAELQIPILALAQLSRNKDEDEMPTLRDLRDSGEIEQNANKVLLLWNTDKDGGMVGLHIAKNRRGATGLVSLRFDGSHMIFTETPYDVPVKRRTQRRRGPIDDD